MNHAALMRVRQRIGDLRAIADDALGRQATGRNEFPERLAVHQFHGEKNLPAGLTGFVNRADVRVI
ncbi:MAG: hypothetical protein A2V91_02815 [Candidatus Muproteobacteria bacterium RBG_16_64_10]|uniref:Uncharacterized protein n=1 Tax=Candidatus Muproteobacteria bacterium RBG_16_64_10 TaxID=1817757 RepID=A0A1F6T5A3_9PROT|nr:MAG: hypothetical protein A2V91_02815 [Candidatus Muproteobacteria bacterium RBG_16_64_10]